MNNQTGERVDATTLRNWLAGNAAGNGEVVVVVDGERAALVVFGGASDNDPHPNALNVPVIHPPDGYLDQLLVHYVGQLHGRPPVVS